MFPLESLIALAMITTAPDMPIDETCSPATIQAIALHMELMDQRESRYVLNSRDDLAADVKLIRCRWVKLRDAPRAEDRDRFFSRGLLDELITFNREYRRWLESRQTVFREGWIADAIADCDWCYQVYDTARDAQCDYYYVTVRRQALKRLRELIGPELYYAGCLPSYIPVWSLRRAD